MSQEYPHKLLGKDITNMQLILANAYDEICKHGKEYLEQCLKQQ